MVVLFGSQVPNALHERLFSFSFGHWGSTGKTPSDASDRTAFHMKALVVFFSWKLHMSRKMECRHMRVAIGIHLGCRCFLQMWLCNGKSEIARCLRSWLSHSWLRECMLKALIQACLGIVEPPLMFCKHLVRCSMVCAWSVHCPQPCVFSVKILARGTT